MTTMTAFLRRQELLPLVARLPPDRALLNESSANECGANECGPSASDEPAAPFSVGRNDAVAWLRGLASASVDLVITDPPYESLEKHRAIGTTTRLKHSKASSNDWFAIFPNARFPELFAEIYRVLRKNSHFYLFCDPETMFVAKPLAEQAGFRFWKPIVWDKRKIGLGYHYRSRYELILFFEKGKRKLHDLGQPDIIEVPRLSPRQAAPGAPADEGARRSYPSEKPADVARVLVRQSSEAGALVVDPFMGSGSTGEAALSLGRRFAGCDILDEAVAMTRRRLERIAALPGSADPPKASEPDPGSRLRGG